MDGTRGLGLPGIELALAGIPNSEMRRCCNPFRHLIAHAKGVAGTTAQRFNLANITGTRHRTFTNVPQYPFVPDCMFA